jgi:hypothetical protein
MTIGIQISDGEGTQVKAGVTPEHALKVTSVPMSFKYIDVLESSRYKLYKQYLKDVNGNYEMNVNGSSSPVEFFQKTITDQVLCIVSIRMLFNSQFMNITSGVNFRRFGTAATAPGLTNGLTMTIYQNGYITDYFLNNVKNVGDFFDYNDEYTNLVGAVASNVDFLSFDFEFESPVILVGGTQDSITVTVSDDLSSLVQFRTIVHGYREILI